MLRGLIGKPDALATLAKDWGGPPVVALKAGFALIPLTDDWMDRLFAPFPADYDDESFAYLHDGMVDKLRLASKEMSFAFVETNYFGGHGGQGAVVFDNGRVIYGPEWGTYGQINRALQILGVPERTDDLDAFDQVGLGAHRSTTDWTAP